jgi:hypothetical protein
MMSEFIGTTFLDGEEVKIYLTYDKRRFCCITIGKNHVFDWFITKEAALKYCKDVFNIEPVNEEHTV